MSHRIFFLAILISMYVSSGFDGFARANSAASNIEKEISQLQAKRRGGKGYESRFKQSFYSALRKKSRGSVGSLSILAPNMFRWQVQRPQPELYVSSGEFLWKYNERAQHAQRMKADSAGLDFLQAVLDPQALKKRYELLPWNNSAESKSNKSEKNSQGNHAPSSFDTKPSSRPERLFAKLIPRQKTGAEDYLYLVANKSTGHVVEIRIAFKNGNRNTIEFQGWSATDLNAEDFQFEPPAGTAIDKL